MFQFVPIFIIYYFDFVTRNGQNTVQYNISNIRLSVHRVALLAGVTVLNIKLRSYNLTTTVRTKRCINTSPTGTGNFWMDGTLIMHTLYIYQRQILPIKNFLLQ